jgi:dTDP-4-amino-4,6-dideoxygalactose transaminase
MNAPAIPFNRPALFGREMQYIAQAILHGHAAGDGPYTRQCQTLLERSVGAQKALLTTSCTHALEMCALLLELQPGDEVIVPSFTFVTTANAFALRGAKLVFADIRPDTLNIDPDCISALITARTKAIVVVHYAGVGCYLACDPAPGTRGRHSRHRRQRPRALREVPWSVSWNVRMPCNAEFSRDEKHYLRRRWCTSR